MGDLEFSMYIKLPVNVYKTPLMYIKHPYTDSHFCHIYVFESPKKAVWEICIHASTIYKRVYVSLEYSA